jgi:bisphosphoglycerate-independent phosphoglycerate mutase (AlkP superfamily)
MTALGCSGDGVGQRNTHQNMNDVPLMHVGRRKSLLSCGSLADFAPAILAILDVSQSIEMTGRPLIGQ